MKRLMSIALMAALSGTGMAALAQAPAPTPTPTPQTAPRVDPTAQATPRASPQVPSIPAKEAVPAPIATSKEAASKEAANQLVVLTAMDANRDGLVSRQEYMTHYEGLYGKIKKDGAGMINLKDFASTGSPVAAAQ